MFVKQNMQRTCTAEESMQRRSSVSTHKVSHSGRVGNGMRGGEVRPHAHLTIFFENIPTKTDAPLWGAPSPSTLKNEAPPSEKHHLH